MIYDVTLTLSPELARWPGDPPVQMTSIEVGGTQVSRWVLGSHAGTHVDAPVHFVAGRETVDALDPRTLLGQCRVLDVREFPQVTGDVLALYDLRGVERLLLRTRNSSHWAVNPTIFDRSFIALDVTAAQAVLDAGIKLLGVDGLSVDPYDSAGEVHQLLLRAGMVIVEGLALDAVQAGDYRLICAPLKLAGSDGAPARVFVEG